MVTPDFSPSGVRFAPSPTGRFHLGNLRTAWISHEWARRLGEPWVVRFEDIDTPRVVPGAREGQLADLAALGLIPDSVYLQSERKIPHFARFRRAVEDGILYPCTCSRREIQEALAGLASAPHGSLPLYTGHCRRVSMVRRDENSIAGVAWRFRSPDESGVSDFIVARTDGLLPLAEEFVPAYHWACALDDFDGDYRLLVRASDLASSTPLQRQIQAWAARAENRPFSPIAIFHTSLVVQNDGHRLEKRTSGVTLSELFEVGWTPQRITEIFRTSFNVDSRSVRSGEIFGEEPAERTLCSLGF